MEPLPISADLPADAGPAEVVLVSLGIEDVGELLTLQRAGYVTEGQLHDTVHLPPLTQSLEDLVAELSATDVVALGLRLGARLAGAVRLRIRNDRVVELARLVVAPDLQGRGLGTRLMDAAEVATPPGTREIQLFTGEYSEANLRLYRRLGYVETHRTSLGRYDLVHLTKSLPPDGA